MSDPDKTVTCKLHGASAATFVCCHLVGGVGRGFYTPPADGDPRPDAWCAHCDEVLDAEGEWTADAEGYARISLLCSTCYDVARQRNLWKPEPPSNLAFRCATCGRFHSGPLRDFGFDAPVYWSALSVQERSRATLTADTCVIDDDRFIRTCLHLPVVDGEGPLVLGVWVSLSHDNFERFVARYDDPRRWTEAPYFGWFSSKLTGYPDTLNLKTTVHLSPGKRRPWIELEPTDHLLARDYWEGLAPERLEQVTMQLLSSCHPQQHS